MQGLSESPEKGIDEHPQVWCSFGRTGAGTLGVAYLPTCLSIKGRPRHISNYTPLLLRQAAPNRKLSHSLI